MRFNEIRNAADPYFEILDDGAVKIRGEALEALDDCMDDEDFGNVVRFSLMVALIAVESGAPAGVRIGETLPEASPVNSHAMATRETTE